MNRLNNDILFIKKSDKIVIVTAVSRVVVIAENAAVLDWMDFFLALIHYGTKEVRRVFCFLYVIPSLFFFFADGVAWYVCLCEAGEGAKKSQPLDLSRCSNKNPLSRAAFCVQSANRLTEIISHNSLLQKNRKRWKALMTVKGLTRER